MPSYLGMRDLGCQLAGLCTAKNRDSAPGKVVGETNWHCVALSFASPSPGYCVMEEKELKSLTFRTINDNFQTVLLIIPYHQGEESQCFVQIYFFSQRDTAFYRQAFLTEQTSC